MLVPQWGPKLALGSALKSAEAKGLRSVLSWVEATVLQMEIEMVFEMDFGKALGWE